MPFIYCAHKLFILLLNFCFRHPRAVFGEDLKLIETNKTGFSTVYANVTLKVKYPCIALFGSW